MPDPTLEAPVISRPIPVTALIDWNCQIHLAKPARDKSEPGIAAGVLQHVGKIIARTLTAVAPEARFDVNLRLYHGWYKGFQPTKRRIAVTTAIAQSDFSALSDSRFVAIRETVELGDRLISALDQRLMAKTLCHIPNTLRDSILDKNRLEEKMVDTAIASDLIDLAHREADRWLLVLGEDDDLVPPALVAEGIRVGQPGRVILVRSRGNTSFFNLNDLRYYP